jgi:predicted ArsR family transcriptional regulator
MLDKQKAPAGSGERASKKFDTADYTDNSAASQRARILAWLLTGGPLSTLQARQILDCFHPAARIQELREAGHNIVTEWTTEEAQRGRPHRIARYVLLAGRGSDQ